MVNVPKPRVEVVSSNVAASNSTWSTPRQSKHAPGRPKTDVLDCRTGMAIIQAIMAGERRPLVLAKLRNAKCQHTEAEIARGR